MAFELYQLQVREGRCFIHEHPKEATSWKLKEVSNLRNVEGMFDVVADQCMYGLAVRVRGGRSSAVKRPTRFLTNAERVADELQWKCNGGHTRQRTMGSAMYQLVDTYPPDLRRAICRGVTKELKMKKRNVEPIMMLQANASMSRGKLADEWHDDEVPAGARMEAWDELTGLPLYPSGVLEARQKELSHVE